MKLQCRNWWRVLVPESVAFSMKKELSTCCTTARVFMEKVSHTFATDCIWTILICVSTELSLAPKPRLQVTIGANPTLAT